jgi:NifU-like protein involved in Fe-S cluster formation
MADPSGAAVVIGLCGDGMEFYLDICGGIIQEARYHTAGCADTRECGRVAAELALARTLMDALAVSPRQVIDALPHLPERSRHCAILAVAALHRAIADYLLKP